MLMQFDFYYNVMVNKNILFLKYFGTTTTTNNDEYLLHHLSSHYIPEFATLKFVR